MAKFQNQLTALRKSTYLGSHPAVSGQASEIDVIFTTEGVVYAAKRRELGSIPWNRIVALEADSREDIDRRITGARLIALGAFALVAKKETTNSYLVITDDRGEWIFRIPGLSSIELRSGLTQLQPYVSARPAPALAPPSAPAPLPPPATTGPAERIQQLKALLDQGLISEAEFAARRTAILDSV